MIENLDKKFTNTGDYVVAFVDILGMKAKWKDDNKSALELLFKINNCINSSINELKLDVIVRTFSDNYFIASEVVNNDVSKALNNVANVVGNLACKAMTEYDCLIRGSIVRGNMHIDEKSILGDALIRAYKLESEIAVYPRILVDKSIISSFSMNCSKRPLNENVFQDFDMKICLNVLKYSYEKLEDMLKLSLAGYMYRLYRSLETIKDEKVIMKINWIINYVNSYYLEKSGDILLDFDKLRAEENKEATES